MSARETGDISTLRVAAKDQFVATAQVSIFEVDAMSATVVITEREE
jgi:hypothetical protein